MNDFVDLIGPQPELVLFIAVAILVIVILIKGIRIVPEGRAKIVERLGRRHKTIFAGINIIIPFLIE